MSVTAAKGFVAAGVAAGIKGGDRLDVALIATADGAPATAAGVFTKNKVCAAPVQISRRALQSGAASAIIVNSGNANAATGEQGRRDAVEMCERTANLLHVDPDDVLVCSTGLIGFPLPMEAIRKGIDLAVPARAFHIEAGQAAADAICTTDTVRKEAAATFVVDGQEVTVGGMAKGAGMLEPAMATMLAFVTTDARVERAALETALKVAVDDSFNAMTVDGCMSTNDTVLVLANGAAENREIRAGAPEFHAFADALTLVCRSLCDQIVHDAEGATRIATLTVRGARDDGEARSAARTVANSQLVQCSLDGGGAYWGRVYSELGASGVTLDPEDITIKYNGITVCDRGVAVAHDEGRLARSMQARDIAIDVELHQGDGKASMVFTALSHAYVDENRGVS